MGSVSRIFYSEQQMNNNILLSVIIPVYNKAEYLAKCIESILKNKLYNTELIFIDDGSDDGSDEILDRYACDRDNFIVVHTQNRGVSMARNLGLKIARGEYVGWIDPDDYISPEWFSIIYPHMLSNYDLIMFEMGIENEENKLYNFYAKKTCTLNKDKFIWDLQNGYKIQSHLCSKVFKKKLFEGIKFPTYLAFGEDFAVMHEVAIKVNRIKYLHSILYFYVQHDDSLVNDNGAVLKNNLISIELNMIRRNFFFNKHMKINNTGLLGALITFLWNYRKASSLERNMYLSDYKQMKDLLICRYFKYVIFSELSTRMKIKSVIIAIL